MSPWRGFHHPPFNRTTRSDEDAFRVGVAPLPLFRDGKAGRQMASSTASREDQMMSAHTDLAGSATADGTKSDEVQSAESDGRARLQKTPSDSRLTTRLLPP